jgi:hypothetical protein
VPSLLPAGIAKLLGLHPVGMLFPVFRGRVIPVFAIIALQCDDFAHAQASL